MGSDLFEEDLSHQHSGESIWGIPAKMDMLVTLNNRERRTMDRLMDIDPRSHRMAEPNSIPHSWNEKMP